MPLDSVFPPKLIGAGLPLRMCGLKAIHRYVCPWGISLQSLVRTGECVVSDCSPHEAVTGIEGVSDLRLPMIIVGDEARAPGPLVCNPPSLFTGSVDLQQDKMLISPTSK